MLLSVNLPSKSIATTETKVYGPVRQAPYSTTYDQLTFSMYLSKDLRERKSMENWMHYIVDYDNHKIRYLNDNYRQIKLFSDIVNSFKGHLEFTCSNNKVKTKNDNKECWLIRMGCYIINL